LARRYAQLRKQQATYARRRIDAVTSLSSLVPPVLTPSTARDWVQQMDELAEETHELHTRVTANIKKFEAKLAADGHKLLSELIDTVHTRLRPAQPSPAQPSPAQLSPAQLSRTAARIGPLGDPPDPFLHDLLEQLHLLRSRAEGK
jgi:hypothetical protein